MLTDKRIDAMWKFFKFMEALVSQSEVTKAPKTALMHFAMRLYRLAVSSDLAATRNFTRWPLQSSHCFYYNRIRMYKQDKI